MCPEAEVMEVDPGLLPVREAAEYALLEVLTGEASPLILGVAETPGEPPR